MKKFFALISGPSTEVEKSSLSEYAGNLISYSFLGLVNDNYYIFVIRGWGRGGWGGGGETQLLQRKRHSRNRGSLQSQMLPRAFCEYVNRNR